GSDWTGKKFPGRRPAAPPRPGIMPGFANAALCRRRPRIPMSRKSHRSFGSTFVAEPPAQHVRTFTGARRFTPISPRARRARANRCLVTHVDGSLRGTNRADLERLRPVVRRRGQFLGAADRAIFRVGADG